MSALEGERKGRDGIDLALDQSPGARDRIQRGLHNMKVAAVTTLAAAGAAAAVDAKAGIAAGLVGASITVLSGLDEVTMPYIDSMDFPNSKESSQEVELTQNTPVQIP